MILHTAKEDFEGRMEITFDGVGTIMVGVVSMMPKDNFRGMRKDVIEKMKQLGIKLLRWPGGNFAGEYHWKDGLLPRNMRAPLQSYLWLKTQPHTNGYDFHDINTDDFIALCREIGAEPFITLNPTWNTPEESAQWVEYLNGSETTEYGALRAKNGSKEPYNVRFWSLGNTGCMDGAEVVQIYLSGKNCDVVMPLKELKGYKRVEVRKGETERVSVTLGEEAFSYYDQRLSFGMHDGDYTVLIGTASDNIAHSFEVKVRGGAVQMV